MFYTLKLSQKKNREYQKMIWLDRDKSLKLSVNRWLNKIQGLISLIQLFLTLISKLWILVIKSVIKKKFLQLFMKKFLVSDQTYL